MDTLLHRHQGWIGALALILGFAIAASPTFAPPLTVMDPEPKIRTVSEAFGVNYVDDNIAMLESNITDFRLRSHEDIDSASRREARALLPALERELGELRCLRK